MVEGLKTYNVWGVLPGATDEKILVIAHRDGYFEAAGDNASGMATMVGLAEYFAKIPRTERRRTIEFIGTTGHHGTAQGVRWIADNAATALAKTALIINAEHTALTAQHQFAGRIRASNTMNALHWSFNGSRRLIDLSIEAFKSFGVPTYVGTDGVAMAEISPISRLAPSFGVIDVDTYYHSDHETDETVPWTGLGATTRAMAKIIDSVNRLEIAQLQP
jgi:Zn-dependent M28 family amino/carboxypeptidase